MARMLWPGCAYLSSIFLVMAVGCQESETPAKISQPEMRSSEKQTRSSTEQALSSAEQNSEAAGPIKVEFFTESGRIPLLSIGDLRLRMTNRSANSVVIERVWPTPQWLEIRDASGQEVPSEIARIFDLAPPTTDSFMVLSSGETHEIGIKLEWLKDHRVKANIAAGLEVPVDQFEFIDGVVRYKAITPGRYSVQFSRPARLESELKKENGEWVSVETYFGAPLYSGPLISNAVEVEFIAGA